MDFNFSPGDIVTIIAIVGLVALEAIAMCTGNDGATFMPVVSIVAGLAGYKFKERVEAKKPVKSCPKKQN
jgi:hypothetical protein